MRTIVALAFALGTTLVLIFGIALALPKYNAPPAYRLAIATEPSHHYAVRVIGSEVADFSVPQDGIVTIAVPRLPRSCSWMCLGITIRDGSPYHSKAIQVPRDGKVLRRLSLRQLERMRLEESGVRKIAL